MRNVDQIGFVTKFLKTSVSNRIGKFSNKTVKEFCSTCNNGWMSGIETAAKPLLSSWILKRETVIPLEEKEKILQWATLRVVVMDMDQQNWLINKEVRHKFYNDRLPIKNLSVWIGKADVLGEYQHAIESIRISPIINSTGKPNTRSYLWIAGGLMVWALYSTAEENFDSVFGIGANQMIRLTNNDQLIDTHQLTVWGQSTITFLSTGFQRLATGDI